MFYEYVQCGMCRSGTCCRAHLVMSLECSALRLRTFRACARDVVAGSFSAFWLVSARANVHLHRARQMHAVCSSARALTIDCPNPESDPLTSLE